MKRVVTYEIIFGLFALALIYMIIAGNASITGFVTSPAFKVSLVYPSENLQTTKTSMEFMFKYPYNLDVSECSLILNDQVAKTTRGLLSPVDTRIRTDLAEGVYVWSIECYDESSKAKLVSVVRRLVIGEKDEEPELIITQFKDRDGNIYEFEIKEGLELELNELLANDMVKVKQGLNTYEMHLIRLIQDYTTGVEMVEFMIIPGSRRIKFIEGQSSDIDFNNDGQVDLVMLLNKIAYRKAYFVVSTPKVVAEEVEEAETGISPPTITIKPKTMQDEKEPEKESPAPVNLNEGTGKTIIGIFELLLIGFIIILIIVLIATVKTRKHKEEKEYVSTLKNKINSIKNKSKSRKKAVKKKKEKKAKKKTKA